MGIIGNALDEHFDNNGTTEFAFRPADFAAVDTALGSADSRTIGTAHCAAVDTAFGSADSRTIGAAYCKAE